MQHAHQKGIIHRDLKPSNVMVAVYDGRAIPKVIDFGVAKATEQSSADRTRFTGFGSVIGTVEYMSPEQAGLNQLDIDTRSDVYSLGVLLYELLTGTTPLEVARVKTAALFEVLRLVREEEAMRPSTRLSGTEQLASIAANRGLEPKKLSGLLRGELDWIVMKALDKDRARRYGTASGMAADVRRHLDDEPVQARPASAAYRVRKFARRNKGPVLAAMIVLLVLIGGIAGTAWQAVRAGRERDEKRAALAASIGALAAEAAARRQAMAVLESLTDDVVVRQMARQATLGDADLAFLRKILIHLQAFAGLRGESQENRSVRAVGEFRVAYFQSRLGQDTDARASYERAIGTLEQLVTEFPHVRGYRSDLLKCRCNLANLLSRAGERAEALTHRRQAAAMAEQLAAEFPVSTYLEFLAITLANLGLQLGESGEYDAAVERYSRAVAIQKQILANVHDVGGIRLRSRRVPTRPSAVNCFVTPVGTTKVHPAITGPTPHPRVRPRQKQVYLPVWSPPFDGTSRLAVHDAAVQVHAAGPAQSVQEPAVQRRPDARLSHSSKRRQQDAPLWPKVIHHRAAAQPAATQRSP